MYPERLNTDEVMFDIRRSIITLDMGFRMAKHPFYNQIWTHEDIADVGSTHGCDLNQHMGRAWFEKVIKQKVKMINEYIDGQKWNSYIWAHERPWRVEAMHKLVANSVLSMQDDATLKLLMDIWIDTEAPHQSYTSWRYLFRQVNEERMNAVVLDADERKARKRLKGYVDVYRGIDADREENPHKGFSWTLDEGRARWFATRLGATDPVVITASVPKVRLVGPIKGRGEDEMLMLDPQALWITGIITGVKERYVGKE